MNPIGQSSRVTFTDNGTERLILHPHCPFDQIQNKPMLATLNDIVECTGNNTLLVTTLMLGVTITD